MSELDQEKIFYERFWCLLRDRQLMAVFEKYGPEAFRRSSVLEGFESFIKGQGFGGKTCVEIGTLKGLTALVLSRYFERVVTIDIVDDPQKREIAAMLGVKNIGFVNVRDNEEKAEVLASVQFDAAFVDGDHHKDTDSDFSLVEKCGRVLFHEAWAAQPAVMNLLYGLPGTVVTQQKWAIWTR
jgi:SAM-dependent methyltransferases related to tRNA (uracil-5-)-methyltransferase